MARKSKRTVEFRRKREKKTDYKNRLKLLLNDKPRLVVRKSSKNVQVQLISYETKGDKIIVSAHTSELKKLDWNFGCGNIPAAYLVGYLVGKRMITKGIKETILDVGLQGKGNRLFSVLKGVIDAGIIIPHKDKILPSDELIKGEHINKYTEKLSADKEKYNKQFSAYIKNNCNTKDISKTIDQVKEKMDKK
jgi:large subunit ribosomal protein L18